jgi:segregation and condensation protein A
MHDKIFQILVEQNDIGWKAIICDLVKSEGMDPWDVDVSMLAARYIERLKEYKSMDFKISGKVLLAAAILLKIKSKRLVGEDLSEFDRLLSSGEMSEEEFYAGLGQDAVQPGQESYELLPRTPQPRTRKISVFDLVRALEQALEVKHRRLLREDISEERLILPEKRLDLTIAIKKIYKSILGFFVGKNETVTFSQLLPSQDKIDKIHTFVPLLHLSMQRKIDLEQKEPFGEIGIKLASAAKQARQRAERAGVAGEEKVI